MQCRLCNAESEILPLTGATEHIICKQCGEYEITLRALSTITDKVKYILSGKAFNTFFYAKTILHITAEMIIEIESQKEIVKMVDKLFLLSKYIYFVTAENGIGFTLDNVPLGCCYVKNSSELLELLKTLRKYGIIEFKLHENGNFCSIFGNIKMTTIAFSKFESVIESADVFKETFMDTNKTTNGIRINNSGNIAFGSNNYQINQKQEGISESELIECLLHNKIDMNTIDSIRNELKEIIVEYNKDKIDKNKVHKIFSKLKGIGGNILLSGFTLLTKPEIVQVIENVKKLLGS